MMEEVARSDQPALTFSGRGGTTADCRGTMLICFHNAHYDVCKLDLFIARMQATLGHVWCILRSLLGRTTSSLRTIPRLVTHWP